MQKIVTKNLKLVLLLVFFVPKISLAQEAVSTAVAIDQIQKTLMFSDKDSAVKKSKERKSAVNIDRSGDKLDKSAISIVAVDQNYDQKNSQKEKLAYNAAVAGQYEAAVELYKQILKTSPKNDYAKFALATCYHKLGQYSQAKTLYYQLLKSNDSNDEQSDVDRDQVVGNLLEVIVEESPNDAVYLLSKLSNQNPNSARILANSAAAYDKINKPDQAILLLNRAVNIDPSEVKYKFNLAILYDKTGDYQNAFKFYQDVISSYVSDDNIDNSIPMAQVKQRLEFIKSKI